MTQQSSIMLDAMLFFCSTSSWGMRNTMERTILLFTTHLTTAEFIRNRGNLDEASRYLVAQFIKVELTKELTNRGVCKKNLDFKIPSTNYLKLNKLRPSVNSWDILLEHFENKPPSQVYRITHLLLHWTIFSKIYGTRTLHTFWNTCWTTSILPFPCLQMPQNDNYQTM